MKKKLMLLLACILVGIGSVMAQTKITGKVISSDDGQPIVGASVLVTGTRIGASTDVDGNFTLPNVPSSAKTLRVSYIGMQSKIVNITGGRMKITLQSDEKTLDEVVVTAMGIKRSEKAVGYSVTSVKSADITKNRTSDIMSGLSGKIAGVQITSTSSDPGSSNSVVIRGFSSLSGSNQPLYVIDGVPMNNTSVSSSDGLNNGFDFGNGANAVNPDDVDNISVLKGAAATALYGSRAACGVIMITTKSGKKNKKGVGIEYNGGVQWSTLLRLPQMQNDFGMGWYGKKTQIENGSWGPRFDGIKELWGNVYNNSQKLKSYVPMENNIKDFFDTGVRYNNSISFNGATDKGDYYVSASQIYDDGIIPTNADNFRKYTFSARGSHKEGALTFSTSLNYAYQKNNFASTGQGLSMYNSIMQTPRDISIIGLKDLNDPFNMPGYYYTPYGVTNPYYVLNNNMNEYDSERFYGKFQVDYDFLKYFKLTYRFGIDSSTGTENTGQPNLYQMFYDGTANGSLYGSNSPFIGKTGSVTEQITRRREINQDIMVTFNKDFTDFNVNAIGGFNGNERTVSYLYSKITDLTIPTWYNLSNTASKPTTNQYSSLRRLIGAYAQVEGAWKNMLYLTLTARNDWSSTLPKNNRSFFYPGVTASYIFTETLPESLKSVINYGKFRIAWGKTGNDAAPYMVNPVYAQSGANGYWNNSTTTYMFPYTKTGVNAYTVGNVLGSNTLSPEMTSEFELGLNMSFLKDRLSFDASFYNRITDKQIYSLDMDYSSGYTAQNTNIGKIRNRGFEILLKGTPIKTKDFSWDLTWNFTKNWSKVLSLPEELGGQASIYGFSGGTGLYAEVGKPLGVFKAEVPQRTADGKIIVNPSTGLPIAQANMQTVGDMNHKYEMGFGTTIRYKTLSLSADLDVRRGGLMYSHTKNITYFTGNAIQTTYNSRSLFIIPNSVCAVTAADGKTTTYVPNTTPLDETNYFNYFYAGGSDMGSGFLIDKSYVKLRSVVLTWELPKSWLAKTPFTTVRLSAFGNNLFVWTPSSNTFVDPEVTSFGNDLEGNFGEYLTNPSSRHFGFNLNVQF